MTTAARIEILPTKGHEFPSLEKYVNEHPAEDNEN